MPWSVQSANTYTTVKWASERLRVWDCENEWAHKIKIHKTKTIAFVSSNFPSTQNAYSAISLRSSFFIDAVCICWKALYFFFFFFFLLSRSFVVAVALVGVEAHKHTLSWAFDLNRKKRYGWHIAMRCWCPHLLYFVYYNRNRTRASTERQNTYKCKRCQIYQPSILDAHSCTFLSAFITLALRLFISFILFELSLFIVVLAVVGW